MNKPFPDNSKEKTLVCKSHGVLNNIFNPIYKSWDKITLDINLNVVRCIGLVLTILKRYGQCI